jgi:hypothetical protein
VIMSVAHQCQILLGSTRTCLLCIVCLTEYQKILELMRHC